MSERNERIVKRVFELLSGSSPDFETLMSLFSDDSYYWALAPVSPLRRGPSAIVEDLKKQFAHGGDLAIVPHAMVSSDRYVVLERTDFVTVPHNRRRAEVRICGLFELNDEGQITAWREYWDSEMCRQQMGMSAEELRGAIA
jgi:limonene-1,2-epoxide hydrolase